MVWELETLGTKAIVLDARRRRRRLESVPYDDALRRKLV